jgi:hypothetical protein
MRSLHVVGAGVVLAALCGCQSATTSVAVPTTNPLPNCANQDVSANKLIVCVRVPPSQRVSSLDVSVSLYGKPVGTSGKQAFIVSNCPMSGGEHLCVASFPVVDTAQEVVVDQIEIGASYALGKRVAGTFPMFAGAHGASETAVLGGSIKTISVVPFLSTNAPDNGQSESDLPLGQQENVWVIARDPERSIIIGKYEPEIVLSTSSNIVASPSSPKVLTDSGDAAGLQISWAPGFLGAANGSLTARGSAGLSGVATILPSSGVVLFRAGPNDRRVGAGPVATRPDGTVYFIVNDKHCLRPGSCRGEIGRFDPSTQKFDYVPLRTVPGVSQLYVTRDHALWMATFQPAGGWNAALPVLRMPPRQFSSPALQTLPPSFGEASGFAEDDAGNLWISGCRGAHCSPDHNGTPIVVETSVSGSHVAPKATVDLNPACAQFGYLGFTVGDVAFYRGDLYVIGLNDGSPPPARGTIWQVSDKHVVSCRPAVPSDFNPSPYFAKANKLLVLGVGGNSSDVHWDVSNGFYAVQGSGDKAALLPRDKSPLGTATHLSASRDGKLVYYIANGVRDIKVFGLSTYVPNAENGVLEGSWNIFPAASFSGAQLDNGVSAVADGAWYTSDHACGQWQGVCLARAVYLAWSAIPQQTLPSITVGTSTTFGILANPGTTETGAVPLNVHSGPFKAGSRGQLVPGPPSCTVNYTDPKQSLTFLVTGVHAGTCLITITDPSPSPGRSQNLITVVR